MEATTPTEINGVPFKPLGKGDTDVAGVSISDSFDTFLSLLTTQLQHQDPLDPLDANQFTEQLVQFAGVEQAISTNKKLDKLLALQNAGQINAALGYLGNDIEASAEQFVLQNGSATLKYELLGKAKQNLVTIVDGFGQPVRTFAGERSAGNYEFVWDGLDNNGNQLPDGVYGFFVTAVDGNGETVQATTSMVGRVTGVKALDGEVTLSVGDLDVPLSDVFAVHTPEGDV